MLRQSFYGLFCVLIALIFPANTAAQVPDAEHVGSADDAALEVRALYQHRDFAWGSELGQALVEQFPESLELQAWTVMSKARHSVTIQEEADREAAVEEAEAMVETDPESPWGWFALAGTVLLLDERQEEALEASDQAIERAPHHPDIVWVKSAVLNTLGQHEETITFVKDHADRLDNPSQLYVSKMEAIAEVIEDETTKAEAMRRAFDAAMDADSLNPNAYYVYGQQLERSGQQEEAFELIARAAEMMPTSITVQRTYWRSLENHRGLSSDEKREKTLASLEGLVAERKSSPATLLAAGGQFERIGEQERQRDLDQRILEIAPDSREAEWALVNEYRAFSREHGEDFDDYPELRDEYRKMLERFIDRSHHHRERLLGDAYRSLFYLVEDDPETDPDVLLEIVEGMVAYEGINPHITHGNGAIALAKHTEYYDRARAIAEEGMEKAGDRIDGQREWGVYDDEEHYQRERDAYVGRLRSALGWVYFHEGRLAEAEEELNGAYQMNQNDVDNFFRLGRLYERQGNLEQAEVFYREGFTIETMGPNPNDDALENLYREMHGSLDSFEEYVAELKELDHAERSETVLASRIEEPEPMHAFTLETLDGSTVSSEEYEGRILAINIWGKWCGPCVREMPDVQALYEKYADDAEVEILTINNDRDLNDLREWLDDHDYTFPVLLDDGFLNEIEMYTFPTTWFVNPQGEIEFVKRGYTAELVEEFSWKIEAIRGNGE